jgi:DeoR family transcriptional regulator of aga operon
MRSKTKIEVTTNGDRPDMLIDERRQHILELIQKQGRAIFWIGM